jgi:hypothetical protein
MPVWGEVLREQTAPGTPGREARTRGTIAMIVQHLRAIQEK